MKKVKATEHRVIYKDPFSYCAHPFIVALENREWLLVFNHVPRRPYILHPPQDPHYYNFLMRSSDQGMTWDNPRVAPGFDWYGVECAGLTALQNGTVLLNQWRFKWVTHEEALKRAIQEDFSFPEDWISEILNSGEFDIDAPLIPENPNELVPWARGNGGTFVHHSRDGGRTWEKTIEIDTQNYSGGYGMRGAVELPGGDILLPLSDVPNYKIVFCVRSKDGGHTWGDLVEVANQEGYFFEEPSALVLQNGTILMVLRDNQTHYLYQTTSSDGGWTWSSPEQMPVWGYPAHLLNLSDGRIICVYGYRRMPYGIRAVISHDFGNTWDIDNTLIIRDDLPNRDLGYPASVLTGDGRIFTVYYGQDSDGVTSIIGTHYSLD